METSVELWLKSEVAWEDLMNDLNVVEKLGEWQRLKALVLDSFSSPITRRLSKLTIK